MALDERTNDFYITGADFCHEYEDEGKAVSEYEMSGADICYECTGYGDDFYWDDDGELVWRCDTCPLRNWK